MNNYYSKINEGGAAASRGFEYQDLCAIRYFLEYVDKEDFVSLTLEQINDFSLLLKTKEMSFQVKDYKISKREINEILTSIEKSHDTINYYIIAPSWISSIADIIQKKKEYSNACVAKRDNAQIKDIQEQLEYIIKKNEYNLNAMICNFITVNKEEQEETILYRILTWNKAHGYEADENIVLSQLVSNVQKRRGVRGSLAYNDLEYIVQNSKVQKSKKEAHKHMNIHKESIIASLKVLADERVRLGDLINLIIVYIDKIEYAKALEKLNELEMEIKDFEIYKAWVLLQLGDYKEVQEICNKILKGNTTDNYASAYFYKGVAYYYCKNYAKAYKYIKKSMSLDNQLSYEQAVYLSKTEIKLHRSLEEAENLLKWCIEIGSNDSEVYYELARLSKPHEAIDLLIKSLKYDEKNYSSRFLLAEYYRILGKDLAAYEQYKIYFSDFQNLKNWRALQGIVYCLFNMGEKEEAETYLLQFMNSFINSAENKIKDHQTAILMDLTWNEMKLFTCTKENNMYRFCSPMGEYCIPVRRNYSSIRYKDGIGTLPDNLLFICEQLKNGISRKELNYENIVKPVFIANYDDDFLFLSKKNILIKNGIAQLNHDWIEKVCDWPLENTFYMLEKGDDLHYQEYIIHAEDVKITIYDYNSYIQVETFFKDVEAMVSRFSKGDGYFNFRKALEKVKSLSWYFFSINRKELLDLCIPTESVNIKYC